MTTLSPSFCAIPHQRNRNQTTDQREERNLIVSVYRRRSGKYGVLIDLESTATGLRRRKSVGTFRTRKEADAAERKALEARDRGIDLSPKTVTVAQLLDRYLADREALDRGAKTLQEYRGCADRLIRPHLGGIALAKLRPARIAEWVAMLLKRGGKQPKTRMENLLSGRCRQKVFTTPSPYSTARCGSRFVWNLSAGIPATRRHARALYAPRPRRSPPTK